MNPHEYLKEVRDLYEQYPFPERKPEDERSRLIITLPDMLERVNHYGFKGKQKFDADSQILVAGGGTGDSTLFIAEQLRETGAQITHLDFSTRSLEIAQQRAKVRQLTNINWIHDSILNLPGRGIGPFDYINCLGVLHHLENPLAGLKALTSVLKENGAMALMLYGTYGRTGLYQMQKLMRLINAPEQTLKACVKNTKGILQILPYTNWLKRGLSEDMGLTRILESDANIVDCFLHPCDRSYTVPEVYDFVESAHLKLIDFTGFHIDDINARELYTPSFYLKNNPVLLEKILKLSKKDQLSIAELMVGSRSQHAFYVAKNEDTKADLDDLNNVPYFFRQMPNFHNQLATHIVTHPSELVKINLRLNTSVTFKAGLYTAMILKQLDGQQTLKSIFEKVRHECLNQKPSNQELLADFKPVFEAFELLDLILLKNKDVPEFYSPKRFPLRN